ncbi:uncharacterized protein [Nicotiana tomentosiformis]|uniref:uncharacterized protein isoform X1 n=1 Tax=Nicotiana tomentosiformis TaxID=4098 RepID=UPI00388CDC29
MTNQNADASKVQVGSQPPAPPWANDQAQLHSGNKVYKSGPLFLSSKGIGWTSWKKRWFTLTENSLVFYRSDPAITQGEVYPVRTKCSGCGFPSYQKNIEFCQFEVLPFSVSYMHNWPTRSKLVIVCQRFTFYMSHILLYS